MFDTFLFLPDAILRTGTITSALDTIQSHPDPRLSQSLFLRVLVGAIASAGGGVTAATLNVWTPNWTLSTPVFLRKNTSVLSTLDLWAGSLVGMSSTRADFRKLEASYGYQCAFMTLHCMYPFQPPCLSSTRNILLQSSLPLVPELWLPVSLPRYLHGGLRKFTG